MLTLLTCLLTSLTCSLTSLTCNLNSQFHFSCFQMQNNNLFSKLIIIYFLNQFNFKIAESTSILQLRSHVVAETPDEATFIAAIHEATVVAATYFIFDVDINKKLYLRSIHANL